MGAAALGACGGPPRPARRLPGGGWPCANKATDSAKRNKLLGRLTRIIAPSESVRFAVQRLQRAAVVAGRARRVHRDRHFVADFQGVALDALLPELAGA